MVKKPSTEAAPVTPDLADLPAGGECDPMDPFTHHWVENEPGWQQYANASGEHRSLTCDQCGISMNEGRGGDPDNPAPNYGNDPMRPPLPNDTPE